MPVALAVIFGVVVLAVVLIGMLWTVVCLIPFYAYVGAAVYLVWRTRRQEAELAAVFEREAEDQRRLNEVENRAWQAFLEKDQRNASKRKKALRDFDRTRQPPRN